MKIIVLVAALCVGFVPAHADVMAAAQGSGTVKYFLPGGRVDSCATEGALAFSVSGSSWTYTESWAPGTTSSPATTAPLNCASLPTLVDDVGSDKNPAPVCVPMQGPVPLTPNHMSQRSNVYTLSQSARCGGVTFADQVVLVVNATTVKVTHTVTQPPAVVVATATFSRIQ